MSRMFRLTRPIHHSLLIVTCLVITGGSVLASPSGLNNIPTTDVTPVRTLVLQTWFNWADGRQPEQFTGFKVGAYEGLELGVDWKAYGAVHGHPALQGKYAFDIQEGWWRGVVGVANVSEDRADQGKIFPYVATSVDVKLVRLHFGFAPEAHNEAFFAGIDRTLPVLNRNLQLKADEIHINDKEDVLFSAGFLYEFGRRNSADKPPLTGLAGILDCVAKNMVLEGWVSMPSTGDPEVYTLKLNYVIKF